MKVQIIHPGPYRGKFVVRQGRCLGTSGKRSYGTLIEPPIFLCYIASVLRDHGHEVSMVDAMAEDLPISSVQDRISSFHPDAVIVETVTQTFYGDVLVAKAAKDICREIQTIYTGAHVTARPQDALCDPNIDFVVRGEPELTTLGLVETLEKGGALDDVKGISYRVHDKEVRNNSDRPPIEPLDQLPFPARDLLPNEKYLAGPLGRMTTVVASRGCPYQCTFCQTALMNGRRFRSRSPGNIADELELIVDRFGTRTIFFYADTFTLDKRLKELCQEIINRRLNIRWLANTRVDTLPPQETLDYMKKSGCLLLKFGVESGSQKLLDLARKGENVNAIVPAIQRTKRAGIYVRINMMILPGENELTINESLDLVKRVDPDLPTSFSMALPFPGTSLGAIAEEKGLFPPDDWRDMDSTLAPQFLSMIGSESSDKLLAFREEANNQVEWGRYRKLRLALKLLRNGEWEIIGNALRYAVIERRIPWP